MCVDKTSTGFAALPCWPKNQARKIALSEAVERWAISNWWTGHLSSKVLSLHLPNSNIQAVRLEIPEAFGFVTILFGTATAGNHEFSYYGFAHGYSLKQAIEKASIELMRNKRVLLLNQIQQPKAISDQRLLYFSTDEGLKHFKSRLHSPVQKPTAVPDLIVDSQIRGEWDQYATVWRCLLPNTDYHWSDPTHFMF